MWVLLVSLGGDISLDYLPSLQARFGSRASSQVCASIWKEWENYQSFHQQGVSAQGVGTVMVWGEGEEGKRIGVRGSTGVNVFA